jgi:hypothetical protein
LRMPTQPTATLSKINFTWRDVGSNPGRRGWKPAYNRLSYGTALLLALHKDEHWCSFKDAGSYRNRPIGHAGSSRHLYELGNVTSSFIHSYCPDIHLISAILSSPTHISCDFCSRVNVFICLSAGMVICRVRM